MAESEPGGGEIARSELRASHDDRDRVVELLRVSAGDGRLTAEELDERLEQAMTARTYGELARLVADLPAAGSAVVPTVSPAMAPRVKDVVRIDTRSGHFKRVDRWVVPQRMEVKVTSGHVLLDFTQAVITQPTLTLNVEVRSGHIRLLTRPGLVVDADDVAIRSGPVPGEAPWCSPTRWPRAGGGGLAGTGRWASSPGRPRCSATATPGWLRTGPRPGSATAGTPFTVT